MKMTLENQLCKRIRWDKMETDDLCAARYSVTITALADRLLAAHSRHSIMAGTIIALMKRLSLSLERLSWIFNRITVSEFKAPQKINFFLIKCRINYTLICFLFSPIFCHPKRELHGWTSWQFSSTRRKSKHRKPFRTVNMWKIVFCRFCFSSLIFGDCDQRRFLGNNESICERVTICSTKITK